MASLCRYLLSTLVVVCLCSSPCLHAFVLHDQHRRHDAQDLARALQILNQERQFEEEQEAERYFLGEDNRNLYDVFRESQDMREDEEDIPLAIEELQDILGPTAENIDGVRNKKGLPIVLGGSPAEKRNYHQLKFLKRGEIPGGRRTDNDMEITQEKMQPWEMKMFFKNTDDSEEYIDDEEAAEMLADETTNAVTEEGPVSLEELQNALSDDDDDPGTDNQVTLDSDPIINEESLEITKTGFKLPGQPPQVEVEIHEGSWPPTTDEVTNLNQEEVSELLSDDINDDKRQLTPIGMAKRSGSGPLDDTGYDDTNLDEMEQDESSLAKEYVQRYLDLEDEENTNLANALNLATLAQVEHTSKYVDKEADFIRQAIRDEEDMDNMKSALDTEIAAETLASGTAQDEEDELETERIIEEAIDDTIEEGPTDPALVRKRFDPDFDQYTSNLGNDEALEALKSEAELLANNFEEEEDENDDDVGDIRALLKEKLEEYLDVFADKQILEESAYKTGVEQDGPYLNPLLRKIYEEYGDAPEKRSYDTGLGFLAGNNDEYLRDDVPFESNHLTPRERERLQEVVDEELEELIEETCPALELLDDCAMVREAGLNLDSDALELCNRHQLCYICGAGLDIPAEGCDAGFLEEAIRLCELESDPGECRRQAVSLFGYLLDVHTRVPRRNVPNICFNTCTEDYIIGDLQL